MKKAPEPKLRGRSSKIDTGNLFARHLFANPGDNLGFQCRSVSLPLIADVSFVGHTVLQDYREAFLFGNDEVPEYQSDYGQQ